MHLLTNLPKNKIKFCFADKEKRAFEQLTEALSKRPVLKIYNTEAETELRANASRLRSHSPTARIVLYTRYIMRKNNDGSTKIS